MYRLSYLLRHCNFTFYRESTPVVDQQAEAENASSSASSSQLQAPSTAYRIAAADDSSTGNPGNDLNQLTAADDQSDYCESNGESDGEQVSSASDPTNSDDSSPEIDESNTRAFREVWPSCWSMQQQNYFKTTYSWLYPKSGSIGCSTCNEVHAITGPDRKDGMRVSLAQEWVNGSVHGSGKTKQAVQKSLRKKISQHVSSQSHNAALKVQEKARIDTVKSAVAQQCRHEYSATCNVFRTAYFVAVNNRPYSDHPELLDLQKLNGVKIGRVLQSNVVCADIVDHIASEMRKKVVEAIVTAAGTSCKIPISVLVDESTALGQKSCLIIYLRCCLLDNSKPVNFFLDLVELSNATAQGITEAVLSCLSHYGLTESILSNILLGFASDGASVMLGQKSGVFARLKDKFPSIIGWHCYNHRVELAVHDAVKSCSQVNKFKMFMDKLYSLYSMSPKNKRLLLQCAAEVDEEVNKIGRILEVRWVASSFRAVKAVWKSYSALHNHFITMAGDASCSSMEKAQWSGLAKKFENSVFLQNLALMFDALQELSDLSLSLQQSSISLPKAHRLLCRQIEVFRGRKERGGDCYADAMEAVSENCFRGIQLKPGKSTELLNPAQFYQALVDALSSRLLSKSDKPLCDLLNIILPNQWPDAIVPEYGEKELKMVCEKFNVEHTACLKNDYRDFKDSKGTVIGHNFNRLINAIESLPVSTAECERGFSRMNIICTPLRSSISVNHMASLMFLSLVGPPLHLFEPISYVKSWLAKGRRDATALNCASRMPPEMPDSLHKSIWSLL